MRRLCGALDDKSKGACKIKPKRRTDGAFPNNCSRPAVYGHIFCKSDTGPQLSQKIKQAGDDDSGAGIQRGLVCVGLGVQVNDDFGEIRVNIV